MVSRSVGAASRAKEADELEEAVSATVAAMKEDMSRIWNSVEIFGLYVDNGGDASQLATRAIYTPLIDMNQADPQTMLTTMVEAARLNVVRKSQSSQMTSSCIRWP